MANRDFFLGFSYVGRVVIYVGIFFRGLCSMRRIAWGLLENQNWAIFPDGEKTTEVLM
jgi:hypothetical protein